MPAPTVSDAGMDDELDHWSCECDPDRALCGREISDLEECEEWSHDAEVCVVCDDLVDLPCERCGQ